MNKDYLTPLEVADYACVQLGEFEEMAEGLGILSFTHLAPTYLQEATRGLEL